MRNFSTELRLSINFEFIIGLASTRTSLEIFAALEKKK